MKTLNDYKKECEHLKDMLLDVVTELQLSEEAIETHGPLGTEPAELVRLVLKEKDHQTACLKRSYSCVNNNWGYIE